MGTTSRRSIAARGRAEDDAALLRREAELRRRPRVLREPQRDRVARVLLQRPHELLERDVQEDLAARAALDHVPLEQPRVEVRPGARVVRGAHEAEAHALAAQPQDAAPAGAGRRRELDAPQRLRDLQQEGERVLGDEGLEAHGSSFGFQGPFRLRG